MELLVVIAVVLGAVYVIFGLLTKKAPKDTPSAATQVQSESLANPNKDAASAIQKIIDACIAENEAATMLLSIIASADGRISRDELKIIAGFCMKQGSLVESEWMESIKRLNSGVNIRVAGDKDAGKHLAELQKRPVVYLAGLYGAAIALTIGRDNLAAATKDTIRTLEAMLEPITPHSD